MSFKQAYFHGGDMVEMDVQLSKDHIPVIYHDFQFCTISIPKDSKKKEQLIPIQLKSLSLKELRGFKIGHVHAGKKEFDGNTPWHDAFPTLEEALEKIDPNCGFNIEIKYGMMLKNGTNECLFQIEINIFLDAILVIVFKSKKSKHRKIVFSSFSPDVCTAVRVKQNRYPVLLLTQGVNTKYPEYADPRTWTIENGSNFVAVAEILGVSAMAEVIQPSQVQLIKNRDQVIFAWTDAKSDARTDQKCSGIQYQLECQRYQWQNRLSSCLLQWSSQNS